MTLFIVNFEVNIKLKKLYFCFQFQLFWPWNGSIVGKIKSWRVKSVLRILIQGLNTELKSFCPIFSTSLRFCLFLALQDLVLPIFWFIWVVWRNCWRFCQKNKGHLNMQKNRRCSNPGTSDFCLYALTWLIDFKGCFINFWKILHFCGCSMNQSDRRKSQIANWLI